MKEVNPLNLIQKPDAKGQGMVEFAMVFPLLLFVLLGIFEFSRLMFTYSAVVSASREAARYGSAIQDVGGGIAQYKDCDGIKAAAKRIGSLAGIGDDDISIQYSNDQGVYAAACPPSQEVRLSDRVNVTISTTIEPLIPLLQFPPIPIQSTANRTILKEIAVGDSGTGVGSISGAETDVNFKTTGQTAEETRGTIKAEIILNQATSEDVTVPFSVTGTADGSDYAITASPVLIPAGSQSATIYITLNNDGIDEGDETLILGLDQPINATKGPQNIHSITITDPPKVSFNILSQTKSEDTSEATLEVRLSKGSSQNVSVSYTTSGDATWGTAQDYTTSPSTISIPSGSLKKTILISIMDDQIDEYDEQAIFQLVSPTNALLGEDDTHTLTITDNDDPPEVNFYFSDTSISEEVGQLTTSVYLSNISAKEIILPFTLSGTTTAGDYSLLTPSPITLPPGTRTADIQFSIAEGDGHEQDETLVITLNPTVNAVLGTVRTQTITITEDTPLPTISFSESLSNAQENAGSQHVSVEMSSGWTQDITVDYQVSGTATAGSGEDYVVDASPLTIPAGQLRGDIQLEIINDMLDEDDESIILTITGTSEGSTTPPESHTLTIVDDETEPVVAFANPNQTANETVGTAYVDVYLDSPSSKTVSIPLTFSGTATNGEDYSPAVSEISIPSGSTSATLAIHLIDDAQYDPDESIMVTMGTPTNSRLGELTEHEMTITDDDLAPCKVESSLLTVGTSSLTWTLDNDGQEVNLSGGSVSWPETSSNQPRLTTIYFEGSEIFSGNEKPVYLSYMTNEPFASETYGDLSVMFDGSLGSGEYTVEVNFLNTNTGDTCSQTISYTKP